MKLLLPLLLAPQILWGDSYKVRPLAKGETISDILYNDNYKPLYGENEWVEKVLKLNRLTETQAKNLDPETTSAHCRCPGTFSIRRRIERSMPEESP